MDSRAVGVARGDAGGDSRPAFGKSREADQPLNLLVALGAQARQVLLGVRDAVAKLDQPPELPWVRFAGRASGASKRGRAGSGWGRRLGRG